MKTKSLSLIVKVNSLLDGIKRYLLTTKQSRAIECTIKQ